MKEGKCMGVSSPAQTSCKRPTVSAGQLLRCFAALAVTLCLLVSLMPVSLSLFASYAAPAEGGKTLEINFHNSAAEADPIPGVAFSIYFAATEDNGVFTLTKEFLDSGIDLSNLKGVVDAETQNALMLTLAGYVTANGISPLASGVTDSDGILTFPNLERGLYLVIGERLETEDAIYTPQPFILLMPGEDGGDVTVEPKYSVELPEQPDEPVERKVLKIWKDEGYAQTRPKSIVVQLICDDKVIDEVELNAENNWRHTWSDLPGGHLYMINEKDEVKGYSKLVEQQGITFVLTNSYNPPPPDNPPSNPDSPTKPPEKLPQTGLLWWPVPLLLGGGVLLTIAGVLLGVGSMRSRRDPDRGRIE